MGTMTTAPTLWTKVVASLQGEVPAAALESYRAAGASVYDRLEATDAARADAFAGGADAWTLPRPVALQSLCTWNAFVLQSLADEILAADYLASPATVGYVPSVTASQCLRLYAQVEPWLARAARAASDPSFELDVAVPADVPRWVEVKPCPAVHVQAMLAAGRKISAHAEAHFARFTDDTHEEHRAQVDRLRGLLSEAAASLTYAEQLWRPGVPMNIHEDIETKLKSALERYYHLGQLIAMPSLVAEYGKAPARRGGAAASAVTAGWDLWSLTDPRTRASWQRDPRAVRAMEDMRRKDPDPARTQAIQAEIDDAFARGDIAYATDSRGRPIGNYFGCPWSPIYVAKRPLRIGGTQLAAMETFTFDVSSEEMDRGGAFKREILVAVFRSTDEVDYCER